VGASVGRAVGASVGASVGDAVGESVKPKEGQPASTTQPEHRRASAAINGLQHECAEGHTLQDAGEQSTGTVGEAVGALVGQLPWGIV
jgi:hypothetical protein